MTDIKEEFKFKNMNPVFKIVVTTVSLIALITLVGSCFGVIITFNEVKSGIDRTYISKKGILENSVCKFHRRELDESQRKIWEKSSLEAGDASCTEAERYIASYYSTLAAEFIGKYSFCKPGECFSFIGHVTFNFMSLFFPLFLQWSGYGYNPIINNPNFFKGRLYKENANEF